MLVPPKSVRMKLEASCELSNTEWWLGPSHDDPLEVPSQSTPALPKTLLVQPFTAWVVTIVRSHIILDYSRMDHFLVFGASYAGGKHRLEHVDTTMYFYEEIHQCTYNWQWKLLLVWLTVSRLGDIHWRLIAGDTQQLALMWMEGHKPLLFPILYHILKFISVSLGKDLSIMRQSSVNSLVCDGSIRWGRSLFYTRNNIGPSTVPWQCVLCPKSQVWYLMISLQDQQFYPSHRETIGSIQRYSHQCRFLGSFSKRR